MKNQLSVYPRSCNGNQESGENMRDVALTTVELKIMKMSSQKGKAHKPHICHVLESCIMGTIHE